MSAPAVDSGLQVFALPDLGEGLTEAELVSWLVAEGDPVAVDQPIAEVETAKSVVEVPSPFAGTVAVLHGRPGEVLDVGAPFLSVRPDGGGPAATSPAAATAGVDAAAAELREEAGVPAAATGDDASAADGGSGNVLIGYGTPGGLTAGRTRPRKGTTAGAATSAPASAASSAATAAAAPAARTTPSPAAQAPAATDPVAASDAGTAASDAGTAASDAGTAASDAGTAPLCVSPLVRKLARDNGVRLADLRGSGEKGLILRRDVEQAIAALASSGPDVPEGAVPADAVPGASPVTRDMPAATGAADAPLDPRSGLTVLERTPLRGVRRTIADAMTRSRREIPEATVWVDVDATALVELRAEMKRRTPDAVPGLLAFVARFVVAGLARYPELNSRIATGDDGAQEIVRVDGVNLGIAAQTDRGLVVPGIRRADTLSARGLDTEIRRLAALAREGRATPSDLSSGTFTLNNYGVFGVDGSAAIINYPESAILGMGRIIDRPWVVDGGLAVRKVTELTLAFDHRVCDGGTAGGFLRFVADAMENPGGMLADL